MSIINGKGVLDGQKRASLKVEAKRDINTMKNEIVTNHFVESSTMENETPHFGDTMLAVAANGSSAIFSC